MALVVMTFGMLAADGMDQWLAIPRDLTAEQRAAALERLTRDAQRTNDRWLLAWMNVQNTPEPATRLTAARTALKRNDVPDAWRGWWILALGQAQADGGADLQALETLDPLRATAGARLRYETCRVLATVLERLRRIDEAKQVLREAAEVAERELYQDPGVDASVVHQQTAVIANDAAEKHYREAEVARQAGQWKDAIAGHRRLQQDFPRSPWVAPSTVALGWCLVSDDQTTAAERLWLAFVASDALGPWRGRALLALVDVALEDRADPVLARQRLTAMEGALGTRQPAPEREETPALIGDPGDGWQGMHREAVLRRILLDLLAGDTAQARERATAAMAGAVADDRRDAKRRTADDPAWFVPAAGIGRVLEVVASGQTLIPAEALVAGKDAANLHLLLADVWILLEDYTRAGRHLDPLLASMANIRLKPTATQRIYARMRQGHIAFAQRQYQPFREAYTACLDEAPRNPWAPHQSLALAVDHYSRLEKHDEAIGLYGRIVRDFPFSHEAQSAQRFIGVAHYWAGRWVAADAAWRELDRRYPGHEWTDVIREHYRPRLAYAQRVNLPPDQQPPPVEMPTDDRKLTPNQQP